jgi:NAD(P)-dependent dehydrogenase (short-subunit alcohol dehydrogenase family)
VALADLGFDLVLLGRNFRRGVVIQNRLSRTHPAARFHFVACDLSSLASVREAAESIRQQWRSIDVLINNAGARFDRYQESVDGFELTFATNHLGPFLLTSLLLDRMLASPLARIVTLSSRRHRSVIQVLPWLVTREGFERWEVYSRTKLANTLFAFELARRLEKLSAVSNVVDPGIVASNFARNNGFIPWFKHIIPSLVHRQLVSCAHAAQTVIYAAASEQTRAKTGKYFYEQKEAAPSERALDQSLAAQLWRSSIEWSGLNRQNCPVWEFVGTH